MAGQDQECEAAVAARRVAATPPLEERDATLFAAWLLISGVTVVVAQPGFWRAVLPDQAGDAPGVLCLYDRDGQLLQETKVDMVQLVERVEWEDRRVRVTLIADWTLPD